MRLFIALDLPDELDEWVRGRQEELKRFLPPAGLRWTPREQWHVTIRFLGECPEHKITQILTTMKRTAESAPSFPVSFGKLGTFSGPRMGVLWVSAQSGSEALTQLATQLNKNLEIDGFPKEERPFRAHVTLARSKGKIPAALLRSFPPTPPCSEAIVDRLHLYQSILSPGGAQYKRLHTAAFRRV